MSEWVKTGISKRALDQVRDMYASEKGEQVFKAESVGCVPCCIF